MAVIERLGASGANASLHGGAGTARADTAVADDARGIDAQLRAPCVDANRDDANVMTRHVAALYVDPNGVYSGLPNVDVWGEDRDARLYDGPHPVVAHPPCARWSRLAGFTEARFGLRRGEDGGCFEDALRAVRAFGGVIEHPAYSAAWDAFNLPEPLVVEGWTGGLCGGFSAYVEQGRYGLPVKKATWLYAFGVELPELRWGRMPDSLGERPNGPMGGMDEWRDAFGGRREQWLSSTHRGGHHGLTATTPPEFRDVLLAMARSSTRALKTEPPRPHLS